ncbi:DNA repair protein RadC [Serratia sp. 1D1416]|uniref:RadC family protein n=1 Tax=Serratia sp. 1D1416 TaxID=2447890 RepID=UPI001013CBA3|nr:DNA repair protein RadC [Serratia sp. 1D1416]
MSSLHAVTAIPNTPSLEQHAIQYEDHLIHQALDLLEHRIFKGGPAMQNPSAVFDYLRLQLAGEPSEIFAVLFLNSQHEVIAWEPVFTGTIDAVTVHPRVIAQRCLIHNAAAVILAHQHPSGYTEPSLADKLITQRLKVALEMFDVRVLDHVVVGKSEPFSFAQAGLL